MVYGKSLKFPKGLEKKNNSEAAHLMTYRGNYLASFFMLSSVELSVTQPYQTTPHVTPWQAFLTGAIDTNLLVTQLAW